MPPFPPEVRRHGIALSNVLIVRVLHDHVVHYGPMRNAYSYFFVKRQATFLYTVSYPPKVSNRALLARILERVFCY